MNYFLNYENGSVSVDTARSITAQATDVSDIVSAFDENRLEQLTASLDIFAEVEAEKIMSVAETCESQEELDEFVFGEGDFFYFTLERELGIKLSGYPDLRDLQRSQFEHIEFND